MKKIGLFYGTDTGNSERVAQDIEERLEGVAQVELHDMIDVEAKSFEPYKYIILGHPTWYYGELQSHWEDFWEEFKQVDFSGKHIACFGLGDQYDYAEYFLDAMGLTHDIAVENGATPHGYTSTESFDFEASKAVTEDNAFFVGLALDDDQQPELSSTRIDAWVEQIKEDFEL